MCVCVFICVCRNYIHKEHSRNAILQNKISMPFVKLVPIFWFHLSSVARLNASGGIMEFPLPSTRRNSRGDRYFRILVNPLTMEPKRINKTLH